MAITKIPAAGFTGNNFRNIIINGDMSIAQRGTSESGISSGTTYHTIDRFQTLIDTAGTWTQSQDTDVPSGQGFAKSMKFDCTTANGSLSGSSVLLLRTKLEGQNLQYLKKGTSSAESLTLSFWVKSNKTGTYITGIFDADNTRQISKSYTIDSASTWEKKTITFEGDTTGTLDNNNAASFFIDFFLSAGTDYTSGTLATSWESFNVANRAVGQVNLADDTANEWYITGVQLEAGTSSSDFEFLPYDVNLQRCKRYAYKRSGRMGVAGNVFNSSTVYFGAMHPVEMRASPSLTVNSQPSVTTGGSNITASSTSINSPNQRACWIITYLSGATTGRAAVIGGGDLLFDAEL